MHLYIWMQVSQHHYCQSGRVTPALNNNNNTELSSTLIFPCFINAPIILCCPIIQFTEYFDSFNTFSSKQKLQQTLIPGQTSAWFWLAKGEIYIEQLWQIQVSSSTIPCNNKEKSIWQLREVHISILKNLCNNVDKSNNLSKIQNEHQFGDWLTRQGNDQS